LTDRFFYVSCKTGIEYGENLQRKLVRRTKRWSPTVYRVGRTGEIPVGVTKKDKHTQVSVFSFCNPIGLPNLFGFDRLASDSQSLANYRLPSPYQGEETRRGHQN